MAKLKSKKKTVYTLTLNHEEAQVLKALVGNTTFASSPAVTKLVTAFKEVPRKYVLAGSGLFNNAIQLEED